MLTNIRMTEKMFPYLRNVFDECDEELDIREEVEVVKPGDDFTHSYEQGDEDKEPDEDQYHERYPGYTLPSSLSEYHKNYNIDGITSDGTLLTVIVSLIQILTIHSCSRKFDTSPLGVRNTILIFCIGRYKYNFLKGSFGDSHDSLYLVYKCLENCDTGDEDGMESEDYIIQHHRVHSPWMLLKIFHLCIHINKNNIDNEICIILKSCTLLSPSSILTGPYPTLMPIPETKKEPLIIPSTGLSL